MGVKCFGNIYESLEQLEADGGAAHEHVGGGGGVVGVDVLEAEADVGAELAVFVPRILGAPAYLKFRSQIVEVRFQIGGGAGDDGLDV